jgi:hypothetical protein
MKKNSNKPIKGIVIGKLIIKYSDIILGVCLFLLAIFGIRSYYFEKEKLNGATTIVKAKVIWIGQSAGKRVGQCEIKCDYTFNSKHYQRNFECNDLIINEGDCIEIFISNEDNNIAQINYSKVLCD